MITGIYKSQIFDLLQYIGLHIKAHCPLGCWDKYFKPRCCVLQGNRSVIDHCVWGGLAVAELKRLSHV